MGGVGYIQSENEAVATIARVVENLERSGCFETLATEPDDRRRWQDHDLASMAENRLGVVVDLENLSDRSRQDLIARATVHGEGLGALHPDYFRHYWLVDDRQRVGTLAIATSLLGRSLLGISSLYVVPAARGRGHAGRALHAVHRASLAAGLSGIRLSTDWSWQTAVRFYLKHAMWVWGWKRSLDLIWRHDLPTWRSDFDRESARFVVVEEDTPRPVIVARRAGDRLEWSEAADSGIDRERALDLAAGTFAL